MSIGNQAWHFFITIFLFKSIVSDGWHKLGGEKSGMLSPSLSNCSDRTIGYEEENKDAGMISKFVYSS